jgi:predicted transposase/invertase (TIGR01784 family)
MDKQFYPPVLDYVFKRVFGDPRNNEILEAFLMAVLDLRAEELENLVIVDSHLKREFHDDKESILDVKVRLKSGTVIDVEIQVEMIKDLRERIVFDAAKMLTEQIKRGEKYQRIEQVVSIIICDGALLPEEPGYYNKYTIRNVRSGGQFTDKLAIHIMEPCKLPVEPDGSKLFKWGCFFKAKTPEELAMAAQTDPMVGAAAEQVVELNEDEGERARADSRLRWQMQQAALRHYSREEGREQAEAEYLPKLEAMKRENEDLRRKLREAGIED